MMVWLLLAIAAMAAVVLPLGVVTVLRMLM
jgi:hypothetical protein